MLDHPLFNVVGTAASVFLITFIGAILRKTGKLTDEADKTLMWLLVNLLMPSLILTSILNNPALEDVENIFLPPVLGFGSVLLGWGLGLLLYKYASLQGVKEQKSFLLTNAINNYGYLPIPLILALYDRETLGVLFMHNVGVETAIWSVGILIISAKQGLVTRLQRLINAPLCTIALCLLLTYFEWDVYVPSIILKTASMLGQAAIPVGVLIVGSLMYDSMKHFEIKDGFKVVLTSVTIRLLLFPICYLTLAYLIPASCELKRVLLIEAAQPSAMLPIVLAKQYDASPQVAFLIILTTSLFSLVTMPLWIHYGSFLLH
jgi:predicted permease